MSIQEVEKRIGARVHQSPEVRIESDWMCIVERSWSDYGQVYWVELLRMLGTSIPLVALNAVGSTNFVAALVNYIAHNGVEVETLIFERTSAESPDVAEQVAMLDRFRGKALQLAGKAQKVTRFRWFLDVAPLKIAGEA